MTPCGLVVAACLAVGLVASAGSLWGGYRHGFTHGARWLHEGDSWRHRPWPGWWWYRHARRLGLRPGLGRHMERARGPDDVAGNLGDVRGDITRPGKGKGGR